MRTTKQKTTLEEVAEKYAESNQYDLEYYDEGGYQGIEVKSFAEKLVDFTNKWQQERMYSEEEVKRLAFDFYYDMSHKMSVPINLISENATNVDVWFEQFKKK